MKLDLGVLMLSSELFSNVKIEQNVNATECIFDYDGVEACVFEIKNKDAYAGDFQMSFRGKHLFTLYKKDAENLQEKEVEEICKIKLGSAKDKQMILNVLELIREYIKK